MTLGRISLGIVRSSSVESNLDRMADDTVASTLTFRNLTPADNALQKRVQMPFSEMLANITKLRGFGKPHFFRCITCTEYACEIKPTRSDLNAKLKWC